MLRGATRTASQVDSLVVGGGPAGIAVLGNLLEHGAAKQPQAWVDPLFRAGRVNAHYRQVPSNTKAELFGKFATALAPFRQIVDATPAPNAMTALDALPGKETCELSNGADMCLMLTEGLMKHEDVHPHRGQVTAANYNEDKKLWTVKLDGQAQLETQRLVLCTGASPIDSLSSMLTTFAPGVQNIHLDTALNPPVLATLLQTEVPETVGVIGASHSAILVLMNLINLASTTHPNLRVKWFTRHEKLRYVKEMDGWTLYDNTGLKGDAAAWARRNLDKDVFESSGIRKFISKVPTTVDAEADLYRAELPSCTRVVQAIGYKRDPLPELTVSGDSAPITLSHDGLTGRFFCPSGKRPYLPGLFGAGIAFPERVTDPAGNVEHAVGFWKFMKFCNRVVPEWIGPTQAVRPS